MCCVLQTWQRPTLPRLKTEYHWRWGVSRPCSEWERVQPPRNNHQVGKTQRMTMFSHGNCCFEKLGARGSFCLNVHVSLDPFVWCLARSSSVAPYRTIVRRHLVFAEGKIPSLARRPQAFGREDRSHHRTAFDEHNQWERRSRSSY